MDDSANPRTQKVRQILSSRGLTLYRVSERSAEIFGRSSPSYIPHSLYSESGDPSLIPTFPQMLALSQISDYRLSDWFAALGFDLDLIPRLGVLIPRRRTALLDSSIYDTNAWVPWFRERGRTRPPAIAPLGQLVAQGAPRRAGDLETPEERRFHYAKIGEEDVYSFPHFAPGSIVRVDPRRSEEVTQATTLDERRFFLVEHDLGYSCSQLARLSTNRVVLHSPDFPCTQRELSLGEDARILGRIDAEIRPVGDGAARGIATLPSPRPRPQFPFQPLAKLELKDLLKNSRLRAGLSFREASSSSRWIANLVSDDSYFAATSTLSDYETLAAPPRHIQKAMTLCILYSINFWEFLTASGLPIDQQGHDAMPDEIVPREIPKLAGEVDSVSDRNGFLDRLLERWEEVPLFLRHSLGELTGLASISLSDLFWVGGDEAPIHPWLKGADLIAVNRRIKKPPAAKGVSEQPLYLILQRDGGYLCGCCALSGSELVVHLYPGLPLGARRFRNGVDAEVVGQVTTILRRIS